MASDPFQQRADAAVRFANDLRLQVTNWADFCNAFNSPSGYIESNFPTEADRNRFLDTQQFKQVMDIMELLMGKFGVAEGGAPTRKNGVPVILKPNAE